MGLIYWIVVGLIAGWLAGKVMKGGGYGVLVDIILGILGGIIGGWVFGMLGIWPGGGMIGYIIVAFVGAVILVWITRLLKKPDEAHRSNSPLNKMGHPSNQTRGPNPSALARIQNRSLFESGSQRLNRRDTPNGGRFDQKSRLILDRR